MTKIKNLVNKKFGKLTVINFEQNKPPRWNVVCTCGNKKKVLGSSLRNGLTKSCGCWKGGDKIHGFTNKASYSNELKNKFYRRWTAARARCNNINDSVYSSYGGRGINFCIEWNEFINFKNDMWENFLKHYKKFGSNNTTLDRIKNSKGYSKENCRWATRLVQGNNTRKNRKIKHKGKVASISEWSRKLKIPRTSIARLTKKGWPLEQIINHYK